MNTNVVVHWNSPLSTADSTAQPRMDTRLRPAVAGLRPVRRIATNVVGRPPRRTPILSPQRAQRSRRSTDPQIYADLRRFSLRACLNLCKSGPRERRCWEANDIDGKAGRPSERERASQSVDHTEQKEKAPGGFILPALISLEANCVRRYFTATVNWMLPYLRVIWNV